MKVSHAITLVGLGVGALGIAATQGCSSSSSSGGGGPTETGIVPPPAPTGPTTTSTQEHNFALHKIYLGDTDRTGVINNSAWKSYGYNIDGKISTKDSTDVCTLTSGAAKSTQADGTGGIDNSFGENILPIILTTAGQDAAKKINDSIAAGHFTVMIDTTGLDDADPAQTATGLKGYLNAGGAFDSVGMTAPTWSTADNWPVRPELLSVKTDPTSSTIRFPSSYVVAGTYVNGTPGKVQLSLAISGVSLDININQAVITCDHKTKGACTNGTIAGIINSEELIMQLKGVAGRISTSLCQGSAFMSIAQQIQQASDILSDGTNASGKPCDGISIGLGFDATEIGKPQKVGALDMPSADPCAATDGGTDSGPTPEAGPTDAGGGG
jgi:hypothetical protein